MKLVHHGMTACLCVCLVLGSIPDAFADQTGTFTAQQPPAQAAQLTPEQLQQLVAPIALYPDPLIGQILAAATYPTEIVEGEKWMQEHQGLTGDALAREVDKQQWDPSVKALTQVPAVLANMDQNLAWTSELGDAYVNQQHDLTQWIQTMRQRAMSAGTLKSTPQELVTTEDDTIDIEPASTDLVYVPQYDPWVAYGMPLAVFPGWFPYPGLYLSSPGFSFGLGVGIGVFAGYTWGWNHWGCDWHHGAVVYNHQTFISHSTSIVIRNSFHSNENHTGSPRLNANRGNDSHGQRYTGHAATHTTGHLQAGAARHLSASHRYAGGGLSRSHAFFHSAGSHAFHGGGFHRGGSRGGGHRR
jgi:Protein of unknown function (DUF3300)